MLHLYKSNRLETLAEALAGLTRAPLRRALLPEKVIVQSLGMRRWLSLALAERHGVTMNTDFPFPAAFAHEVFKTLLPDAPLDGAFDRAVLPWRVLGALRELLPRPEFAELRGYCRGENAALKEFQLAGKIAAVFDRYLAYRPELLRAWSKNRRRSPGLQPLLPGFGSGDEETEGWQAQLWRELTRGRLHSHAPALAEALAQRLREGSLDGAALPERVSVFGISSLPPLYLDLLGVVAHFSEVHLFLLEPTPDYWADLVSPRERDRAALRQTLRALPEHEEPPFTGNSLLASLCKTGRDFEWLLLDRLEPEHEHERFIEPQQPTLLGQLQADIFYLRGAAEPGGEESMVEESVVGQASRLSLRASRPRPTEGETPSETGGTPVPRRSIAPTDRTVQIHCCHGPLRELEVLHDQLLDLFQTTPGLAPREILVAMPDVETYAPFIDAVFGAPESEAMRIPYTIADRAARAASSVADTLLRVLDLAGGRFPASEVLALLGTPALRGRFGLAEGDLPLLHAWVERTGIRWGIDAGHRASLDLPAFAQNSWRSGLERLLLGYALPGDGVTLFEGVLPESEVEGTTAIVLGQFVEFTERLFEHCAGLAAPRSLGMWERTLRAVVEAFFDTGEVFADEVHRVRSVLETLGEHARLAEFDGLVDFAAIRAHLAEALTDSDSSPGFLAGHVTFCALKPMRSIPFRVLCLLGLGDTAFPRRETRLTFDLVAQHPRRGDRSVRDDDRYLFLEAILSARETLYLSYAGRSMKDGTKLLPSVLVSELLDYLTRHFESPRPFVTEHRLQAFSRAYFSADPGALLFSYSRDHATAARLSAHERTEAPPFAGCPLPEPGEEWRKVTLDQLTQFFCHPARYFLRERLRLRLADEEAPASDTEPTSLEGLDKYQLRERLTTHRLARGESASDLAVVRAGGMLPPGYAGDSEFGTLAEEVEELVARLRPSLAEPVLEPFSFDLSAGGFQLTGALADLRASALVRYRAGKLDAKHRLRAWLAHLALQLAAPAGHPRVTIFHGTDATLKLAPITEAAEMLRGLLALYQRGLREPLRFFPASSWAYAQCAFSPAKKSTSKTPLGVAEGVWDCGDFARGEGDCPWLQLAFRGMDSPLDAEFEALSRAVFQPLLAASSIEP